MEFATRHTRVRAMEESCVASSPKSPRTLSRGGERSQKFGKLFGGIGKTVDDETAAFAAVHRRDGRDRKNAEKKSTTETTYADSRWRAISESAAATAAALVVGASRVGIF